MKRISAIVLLVAVLLSLASCGKADSVYVASNDEQQPEPSQEVQAEEKITAWETEFHSFSDCGEYYTPLAYSNGGFYCSVTEKIGEDIPQAEIDKAKKKGEEFVNDGRYDVFDTALYFVDAQGKVKKAEGFGLIEPEENLLGWSDFSSQSGIDGLLVDDAGSFISIEHTGTSGNNAPASETEYEPGKTWYDYYVYANRWYIRELDSTGALRSSREIINEDGAYFNPYSAKRTDDGRILLAASGETSRVTAVFLNGGVDRSVESDGYIVKLIRLSDGRFAVQEDYDGTYAITIVDADDYHTEPLCHLPDGALYAYDGAGKWLFLWTDGHDLYGWNLENNDSEKLFSFAGVGVNFWDIGSEIVADEDGTVHFILNSLQREGKWYSSETVTVKEVEKKGTNRRETVTLASAFPSNTLDEVVSRFNRSQKKVKVEPAFFADYLQNSSDCVSALQSFTEKELNGKMPDIIDLTGLSEHELAAASLLEDLYPYMDEDSVLNRDDFFPNILQATETGGKLYGTCAGFTIETAIGAKSTIGESGSWTYSDFMDAWTSMEPGADAFDIYANRTDVLEACLRLDADSFIDWENHTCNFCTDDFMEMLYFASHFQTEFDYENHIWTADDNSDLRVRSGRQMLIRSSLYGMDDMLTVGYEFEDETCFIGYPSPSSSGSMIRFSSFDIGGNFAMVSGCEHPDEAWQFLRTFFTRKYQSDYWFFPTRKDVYEEKLAKLMEFSYLIDKYGNTLKDRYTGEPRIAALGTIYLSDYTAVKYYPLTEEKAKELTELISGITKAACRDEQIITLVRNRAEGYYSGSLTIAEAAKEVQNAVWDYLQNLKNGQ